MPDHTPEFTQPQLPFEQSTYFPDNMEDYAPWVAKYGLQYPYGECQCGCHQKSTIANRNFHRIGVRKNHPYRYLVGHGPRKHKPIKQGPNPSGLCMCGCGQPTPLAKGNRAERGIVAGQPTRYIAGHNRNTKGLGPAETFWSYCIKGKPDECWLWTGSRDRAGYGYIACRDTKSLAHRFSYELHYGHISEGLHVCHNCPGGDNPLCCNPAHLWLGTPAENIADKVSKNRQAKGEAIGSSKLTEQQVVAIRQRFTDGTKQCDIATEFSISPQLVFNIVRRRGWQHV